MNENHSDDIDITSGINLDSPDSKFNRIIGQIEEIIMEEDFLQLLSNFMEEHYVEFETDDENKLIYMDIFKKYTEVIEKHIEQRLRDSDDNFDMSVFENELMKRENELDGEIFEMLSTFSDFIAFKAMFLDYKLVKEGKTDDFSKDILISKYVECENAQCN